MYCEDYVGYFTVILSFLAFHLCSAYFIYLVSCKDKLMSCKYYKYNSSFAVIFLMLSLVILSTWMIVASVRCNRVQMANNILSVVMIVLQLILMRQVHRIEL
jgi:ABC-type Na+ efflux pump permease subunit